MRSAAAVLVSLLASSALAATIPPKVPGPVAGKVPAKDIPPKVVQDRVKGRPKVPRVEIPEDFPMNMLPVPIDFDKRAEAPEVPPKGLPIDPKTVTDRLPAGPKPRHVIQPVNTDCEGCAAAHGISSGGHAVENMSKHGPQSGTLKHGAMNGNTINFAPSNHNHGFNPTDDFKHVKDSNPVDKVKHDASTGVSQLKDGTHGVKSGISGIKGGMGSKVNHVKDGAGSKINHITTPDCDHNMPTSQSGFDPESKLDGAKSKFNDTKDKIFQNGGGSIKKVTDGVRGKISGMGQHESNDEGCDPCENGHRSFHVAANLD